MSVRSILQSAAGSDGSDGSDRLYIEQIFSTYLYTGNGNGSTGSQTITNNIDLSTKGGMVWIKSRASYTNNALHDTARGINKRILSNSTVGQQTETNSFTAFNTTGFSLGPDLDATINASGDTYASWTFRKQPKFFDVVTYTGTGSARTIAHNLGSVPGCIIVKRTNTSSDWPVYHRSFNSASWRQYLNLTNGQGSDSTVWNGTAPTSTVFSVGTDATVNASGGTYVVYLFAHNAGGFGLTGTDNVISCGSYTGNGSTTGPVVTLGYEPQWLMVKNATGTGDWQIIDNMRGMPVEIADATLQANLVNAETAVEYVSPTATGFQITSTSTEVNTSASTYTYIAIRRGPMKVPTTGTQVYNAIARTGTGAAATVSGVGFTPDLIMDRYRTVGADTVAYDRLRGISPYMATNLTTYESGFGGSGNISFDMDGVTLGTGAPFNASGNSYINWFFKRAPGFFDEVCYTGTGVDSRAITHNLGVAPELMIVKRRNGSGNWYVYINGYNNFGGVLLLNTTGTFPGVSQGDVFGYSGTTATTFSAYISGYINSANDTFAAYLFASCPGVSKIGTYIGNGTSQTINCGFSSGARYILIKSITNSGDWYMWDSSRGIIAANDPHVSLNTSVAEVTTDDSVDPDNSGFIVNQIAATNINVLTTSYLFLAIA